jgi:hypothetical protein
MNKSKLHKKWKKIHKWLLADYKYIEEIETRGIWHCHINKKHADFIHGLTFGSLLGVIFYVITQSII